VRRGCKTDVLLAAAVGDLEAVRRHLAADPDCIRIRVTDEHFPMSSPRAGGTIYKWTLGADTGPFQAAAKFSQADVLKLLMERSPPEMRLLATCRVHDRAAMEALLASDPSVVHRLSASDRSEIAHAARDNDAAAVRLLLGAGLPADARGQHHA